ncbi:hypothetical protein Tco_1091863 [Tanacetum coccineum]|uniref:Uncharacterized protein n=1 Tax=Tanacetum coccineum TaxID=301880 RepID=A0ABQ5I9K0_9ASTR
MAQAVGTQNLFNKILATPIDFSALIMHRLKIDNLTQEVLTGPTYDLIKGTCKSVVELKYHLEEVFKDTNDRLDWHNPEGKPYPHDLSNPLPLILNEQGRQVIPLDHFINNDLEYLKGGNSSKNYTTSISKQRLLIMVTLNGLKDKHAYWGNLSLGFKMSEILQICFQHGNIKRCLLQTQDYCSNQPQDHEVVWLYRQTAPTSIRRTFSDDTLNHVCNALNDIALGIEMGYLPKRKQSKQDMQRARVMINAIDKKLRDRRLMRSLEKFVSGRPYGGDLWLLERTI